MGGRAAWRRQGRHEHGCKQRCSSVIALAGQGLAWPQSEAGQGGKKKGRGEGDERGEATRVDEMRCKSMCGCVDVRIDVGWDVMRCGLRDGDGDTDTDGQTTNGLTDDGQSDNQTIT